MRVDEALARKVKDSVDYTKAKTPQVIAEESGVDEKVVKRVLHHMLIEGKVERRGRKYRYECSNAWE
jgi:ribosomal protein S25